MSNDCVAMTHLKELAQSKSASLQEVIEYRSRIFGVQGLAKFQEFCLFERQGGYCSDIKQTLNDNASWRVLVFQ